MNFTQEDLGYGIQNTRSMSTIPQPQEDFVAMDPIVTNRRGCRLLPVMTGEMFKTAVNYPVIVEMWEKGKEGRVKRAFHEQFSDAERRTLARYYGRFYRWHLVTGTPKTIACRLQTVRLLQRAVEFFGTV